VGTVRGRFADDVESTLPAHVALDAASCSCGALGVCRHRIAVVLSYQRQHAAPRGTTAWSPGTIEDSMLLGVLGERTVTAARQVHRAGYPVRLRRPRATIRSRPPSCRRRRSGSSYPAS
jgi:hypothetical protein